jgi:protein translocase SEC61 complex gamma subunit
LTLRDFLRSMASVIRLSRKSDREEFFLYLKLVMLGLGVVGIIGFLIKLISAALPSIFGSDRTETDLDLPSKDDGWAGEDRGHLRG